MIRTAFLTMLLSTASLCLMSQAPRIQTPEVAAINKFIDEPVDMSTGIPSVSIPLFTFNEHGFELPITLNYHAGGIKVDEMASTVGLGWSLSAVNTISRTVRDNPDEIGYYYNNGFGNLSASTLGGEFVINTSGKDLEPDLFYFSINGHSGKFLFDDQQQVHLIPEQDIKIEVTNPGTFVFKVTTSDGTQYIFDNIKYNWVNSGSTEGSSPNTPNAWNLIKIITPSHSEINFEYIVFAHDDHPILAPRINNAVAPGECALGALIPSGASERFYVVSRIYSNTTEVILNYKSTNREDVRASSGSKALDNIQIKDRHTGNLIRKFNFISSYFQSTDNSTRNNLQLVDAPGYMQKRLRLDRLQEFDSSGNTLPPYIFAYNKINPAPDLPNRISLGQDHWGYYNGMSNALWLMGPYQLAGATCNFPSYREVDNVKKKAFILDEIQYPTGGITTFLFDNDNGPGLRIKELTNYPGNNQPPTVKKYEYESSTLVGGWPMYAQEMPQLLDFAETIVYGTGDGVRAVDHAVCQGNPRPPGTPYIAYSHPMNHTGELSSLHSVYGLVTEIQPGNGSIEYSYDLTSAQDYIQDITIYPYIPIHTLLDLGKPSSIRYKDESGTLIKEQKFEYNGYYREVISTGKAAKEYKVNCAHIVVFYKQFTGFIYLKEKEEIIYDKSNHNRKIVNKTTYELEGIPASYRNMGMGYIYKIENQPPPLHHFPTIEEVVNSEGEKVRKRSKYALDYKANIGIVPLGATFDPSSEAIRDLISAFKINQPLEELVTREINGIESVVAGTLTEYNSYLTTAGKVQIALNQKSILSLAFPEALTSYSFSRIEKTGNNYQFLKAAQYLNDFTIEKKNDNALPLQIFYKNGLRESYVWGHNNVYPIAKVKNSAVKDIFFSSFEEETLTGIMPGGKTGIKSKGGGFQKSLTGLSNGKYKIEYWQLQSGNWILQASEITVTNGTYNINLTGQVDDIRFFPANAFMESYTYSSGIGVSSAADIRNINSFYEFDKFGRLSQSMNRNNQILNRYEYAYQSPLSPTGQWVSTGITRCKPCSENNSFNSTINQKQYKDQNPSNPTYNQLTWVDEGLNMNCLLQTDWVNTATAPRCQKINDPDRNNQLVNNGYLEQEQINVNKCSPFYNTKRWVTTVMNTSTCPLPPPLTLYAKFRYTNLEYQEDYTFADIYLEFFLDAACTQPASLPDLGVNYRINDTCYPSQTGSIHGQANLVWTGVYLWHEGCTVTYTILPGTGYIPVN